jgi:hypothetical protein
LGKQQVENRFWGQNKFEPDFSATTMARIWASPDEMGQVGWLGLLSQAASDLFFLNFFYFN